MLTLLSHERTWLNRYRAAIREDVRTRRGIALKPVNPDFEPIVLTGANGV